MGELSWALFPAPEAAAVCYLQICSVQNAEAAQETEGDASPCHPPRKCLQIPSPLSLWVSARGCWHYLFILLHSIMVSTGGGDSPLLIPAGPWLLLVGQVVGWVWLS